MSYILSDKDDFQLASDTGLGTVEIEGYGTNVIRRVATLPKGFINRAANGEVHIRMGAHPLDDIWAE